VNGQRFEHSFSLRQKFFSNKKEKRGDQPNKIIANVLPIFVHATASFFYETLCNRLRIL